MLDDDAPKFRKRLSKAGLSEAVINAAWPDWWSEEADRSPSARAELRYSLARKLGLDPHSLLEDQESPQFIWKEAARFKHLSGESEFEKAALTSFGRAFGKVLLQVSSGPGDIVHRASALELRESILRRQQYVRFVDLVALCWSIRIPTAHLRVFPLPQKRMAAMSIHVADGNAILLGRDANYPPQISFFLAHELAHIFLGHLKYNDVIVDLERDKDHELDAEEAEADSFALELLTGSPKPQVISTMPKAGAASLARAALEAASDVRIEPGTLALCFGFTTGEWSTAYGSLPYIYETSKPVWKEVNRIALNQLSLDSLPPDLSLYVRRVLGEVA